MLSIVMGVAMNSVALGQIVLKCTFHCSCYLNMLPLHINGHVRLVLKAAEAILL